MTLQELTQFAQWARMEINKLWTALGNSAVSCKASVDPIYILLPTTEIGGFLVSGEYGFNAIKESLKFADLLQTEPVPCIGAKALIFCKDATVYCRYHDQDGWMIDVITQTNNYFT